ncbi:MAG: class I SAM-dependent methyltransferase [Acidimicrobiia bacterium]|nr:class I SAM-dependent methyltransferase [Acidimicrobiia bacterium]
MDRTNGAVLDMILGGLRGSTAADVGSGVGRVMNLLSAHGFDVSGCELDPALAATSGADACDARLWAPPAPVDVVTCIELVEHLPPEDHRPLLRRMASWLNEDGVLIVSTPQRTSLVSVTERAFHRVRRKHGPYEWWDPTHISVRSRRYWEHLFGSVDLVVVRRVGWSFAPDIAVRVVPPLARLRAAHTDGPLAVLGFDLVWVLKGAVR